MDKYGMNHIRAWIKFHIIDESDHTAIHHIDDLSSANIRIFQFYHLFQYMPFTRRCCLGIKFFFQNRNGIFLQTRYLCLRDAQLSGNLCLRHILIIAFLYDIQLLPL